MPEQLTEPEFISPQIHPEAAAAQRSYCDRAILLYENAIEMPADVVRFVSDLAPKSQVAAEQRITDSIVRLASCSFLTVREQCGVDADHPGVIRGSVEDGMLATYHNGTHTGEMMMRYALAYARKCNETDLLAGREPTYSTRDLALIVFIASCHDGVQGHGRGNDERLSAEAAMEILRRAEIPGIGQEDLEKAYYGVRATAFDPQHGTQSVNENLPYPHIQKAIAVGDLLTIASPDGPMRGIALAPESLMSAEGASEAKYHQVLSVAAERYGFDVLHSNIMDVLGFIDEHEETRAAFLTYLKGQPGFYASHKFPDERVDGWFTLRAKNVELYRALAQEYEMGYLSAQEVYQICQEYAVVQQHELDLAA